MKATMMILGYIFLIIAGLATPVSIVHGVYEWVGNDIEFKFALWEGVKLWLIMLSALIVGYPLFIISQVK